MVDQPPDVRFTDSGYHSRDARLMKQGHMTPGPALAELGGAAENSVQPC